MALEEDLNQIDKEEYYPLSTRIKVSKASANLDLLYGPFKDIATALKMVPQAGRKVGRTVGILENGEVVEYWWAAGTTDGALVKKISKAEEGAKYTGSDTIEIATGNILKTRGYKYTPANDGVMMGYDTTAIGQSAVAMGESTHADGEASVASGENSRAKGFASVAMGEEVIAENDYEHAVGMVNVSIKEVTLHTVGNGGATGSNAHLITMEGKHYIPNIGGYVGTEKTAQELQAKQDLATVVSNKEDKIEVVQNAPTTITIEPNKLYHWNGVTSLDITLGATTSPTDIFIIQFSCGATPTNLVLHGVKWDQDGPIVISENKQYEIIVINNLASWGGWTNE